MGVTYIPFPSHVFKRRRRQAIKRVLLIVILAIVGIGLFVYPMVSGYISFKNASTATQEYNNAVDNTTQVRLGELRQKAIVYNENLEGNPVHDPFLKDSGMVMSEDYAKVLNIDETGTMAYIHVPKVGIRLPIYHGTLDSTLQKGVGHLEGSSLPMGGSGTHAVLTGHSGLAHARMFTDLLKLEKGDIFYLHVLDETLAYQIDQIKTVRPDEVSDVRRFEKEDYCTLVTCTPYGSNTHRLLVRGTRIEYSAEVEQTLIMDGDPVVQWFTEWNMIVGIAVGLGLLIVAIVMYVIRQREKGKKLFKGKEIPPWERDLMSAKTAGGKNHRGSQSRAKYWWDEEDG